MSKTWRTLRVVVELPVCGEDFNTKDLVWGITRALDQRAPEHDYNKYRAAEHRVLVGRTRVIEYNRHMEALRRKALAK